MSDTKHDGGPAKRIYVLYDARACGAQGTEEASVLVACESKREAKSYRNDYGMHACYSYADNDDGKPMDDERWEYDVLK